MPIEGNTFKLDSDEKGKIRDEIMKIFYEDSKEIVNSVPKSVNYQKLYNALVKGKSAAEEVIKWVKGSSLNPISSIKDLDYLAAIYPLSSLFSEFLRGKAVNYRVFYHNNEGGVDTYLLPAIDFFEKFTINFDPNYNRALVKFNFSQQAFQKQLVDIQRDKSAKWFKEHFKKFFEDYFQPTSNAKVGQELHSDVWNKYSPRNTKLINTKYENRQQVFNRGNIDEAIDVAISEYVRQKNKINTIEDLTFGKYLGHDSVSQMKGGDNPYTNDQLKKSNATVTNVVALKGSAEVIINLLKQLEDPEQITKNTKENIKDIIKDNFYDESRMFKNIDSSVDKSLKRLLQNLKK